MALPQLAGGPHQTEAEVGHPVPQFRSSSLCSVHRSSDRCTAVEPYACAGEYEAALAALEKARDLLGEPEAGERDRAGEWAECVRLAGAVEGVYLERRAPALARLDVAVARLTALGHTEGTGPLTALAAELRDAR